MVSTHLAPYQLFSTNECSGGKELAKTKTLRDHTPPPKAQRLQSIFISILFNLKRACNEYIVAHYLTMLWAVTPWSMSNIFQLQLYCHS